ncbi:MAG: hypothetical protein AAGD07_16155 [Planctomycetota bacterium]
MKSKVAEALLILLSLSASVAADQALEVSKILRKAQDAYTSAVDEARERVASSLEGEIARVKSDKRLDVEKKLAQLDQLKSELDAFRRDDTLPITRRLQYESKAFARVKRSHTERLLNAYTVAAQSLSRLGDLDTAKDILEERDQIREKGWISLVPQFEPGQIFVGKRRHTYGDTRSMSPSYFELKINKIDGSGQFTGSAITETKKWGRRLGAVTGKVQQNLIQFISGDSKYEGKFWGKTLNLKYEIEMVEQGRKFGGIVTATLAAAE